MLGFTAMKFFAGVVTIYVDNEKGWRIEIFDSGVLEFYH